MTTITNINIRVYYKVALYPEDTFDSDNWEDYYDFVKDREDKFNLHLITNDKASFVTKKFIEYCNWNKEDDEYVNKISYYGNGLFIAELYFSYLHLDDIRDMYYETEIKEIILSQKLPTRLLVKKNQKSFFPINSSSFLSFLRKNSSLLEFLQKSGSIQSTILKDLIGIHHF